MYCSVSINFFQNFRYYNLTLLACQLNEMEDGIAPTDSRHRPDQRLMEEGKWNEANEEKVFKLQYITVQTNYFGYLSISFYSSV